MKRSLAWAAVAMVLVLAAGVAVFLTRTPASMVERTADLPAMVRQIQQLNELVTVKYKVQKVIGLEEQKVPFGSEKLLLIVQAEVLGGIDLSELTVQNIHMLGEKGVMVLLPPPKILHTVIDEDQTRVWDRQVTWWTPWVPYSPDLESKARVAAIESVRQTAIGMGILDDAERNAEESIRGLLNALGIERVTFEPVS